MLDGGNLFVRILSCAAFIAGGLTAQAYAGQTDRNALPKQPAIEARMEAAPPVASLNTDPIRHIIEHQLRAFRKSDPAAAYRFASEDARQKYGNAKSFFVMMRSACTSLPGHVSYSFLDRAEFDGKALQKIEFLNADGSASTGFYRLVKNMDGKWAVDGCLMLQSDAQPI